MALVIDPLNHCSREIIIGASRFGAEAGWDLHHATSPTHLAEEVSRLGWRPTGILCVHATTGTHRALLRLDLPLVDVLADRPTLPPVAMDEAKAGILAAQHLAEQGYPQLCLAFPHKLVCHQRATGFQDEARRLGLACDQPLAQREDLDTDTLGQIEATVSWLMARERPVGVFCFNDGFAQRFLQSCRRRGLDVPSEVGVVGCDDDPMTEHLGSVTLSSVLIPHRELGYQTAQILAKRMAGLPDGDRRIIPPTGVVARASTDLGYHGDPLIAAAIAWIADHLTASIGADQIAAGIGATRRTLERRTRQILRRSVMEEVNRQRLALARGHLRNGATVAAAASAVGWSDSTLDAAFRNRLGSGPGAWRERVRSGKG